MERIGKSKGKGEIYLVLALCCLELLFQELYKLVVIRLELRIVLLL